MIRIVRRTKLAVLTSALAVTLFTTPALRADHLAVGKNALAFGNRTSAVVDASLQVGDVALERYVDSTGRGVPATYNGGRWTTIATAPATAPNFVVDSFELGLGSNGVRGVTASGPTPAFNLVVSPSVCEGDYSFQIKSAAGAGRMPRGSVGSWSATVVVTACRDMAKIKVSPSPTLWKDLDRVSQPTYSVNGRRFREVSFRSMKAGESREIVIVIDGAVPPTTTGTKIDLLPPFTIESVVVHATRTAFSYEPVTVDVE